LTQSTITSSKMEKIMKKKAPAPFSFHCIICFEAFNLTDRPPVVLACGHTYICEGCSKQIDRCMECRASLFLPKEQQSSESLPPPPSQMSNRHNSVPRRGYRLRHNHWSSPSRGTNIVSPRKKLVTEPIRLPTPKNQVMMALMELSSFSALDSVDGIEEDEEGLVLDSIESLSGLSGTYIVKEKRGLVIHPKNPYLNKTWTKEEDSLLCKNSSDSGRFTKSSSSESSFRFSNSSTIIDSSESNKELLVVEYGQRVQIVNIVDEVFQLARNRGFITANESQLVKVGPPLEQSCKLEGMLYPLSKARDTLQEELEKVIMAESKVSRQLSKQLTLPESHPIISESTSGGDVELYIEDQNENSPKKAVNTKRRTKSGLTEMLVNKENINVVSTGSTRKSQNSRLDFRTGMSGHLALQSAAKLEKRLADKNQSELFMMSVTRGMNSIRKIRFEKKVHPNFN